MSEETFKIASNEPHQPWVQPHGAHDTEGPTVLHLGHEHPADELQPYCRHVKGVNCCGECDCPTNQPIAGKPMTNTNRAERGSSVPSQSDDELTRFVAELRKSAADDRERAVDAPSGPLPWVRGAEREERAADTIENQGREIERYREALTEVLRTNVEQGHPNKGSDEAGAGCPWCAAFNRVSTALQSPTQAPLQEGER